MLVVLRWFRSSINECEYPGTVGNESVEITGGRGRGRMVVWAAVTDSIPTGKATGQSCKELLRKTQAVDWEGSRWNYLKLYTEMVWHTYCSKLYSYMVWNT